MTGGKVAMLLGCMENQDLPCQTHDWKGSGVSGWLGWVDRQMGVPLSVGSVGGLDGLTDRHVGIASFWEGLTHSVGNGAGCH